MREPYRLITDNKDRLGDIENEVTELEDLVRQEAEKMGEKLKDQTRGVLTSFTIPCRTKVTLFVRVTF